MLFVFLYKTGCGSEEKKQNWRFVFFLLSPCTIFARVFNGRFIPLNLKPLLMRPFLSLYIIGVLLTFAACVSEDAPDAELVADRGDVVRVGQALPAFNVQLSDGTPAGNLQCRGKQSVIVFFHTTCPDCRRELAELQQVYAERGDSVYFLCISRQQPAEEIETYWQDNRLTLPYSAQPDRAVYNLFATAYIPRVYVADTATVVRTVFVEQMGADGLRAALDELN